MSAIESKSLDVNQSNMANYTFLMLLGSSFFLASSVERVETLSQRVHSIKASQSHKRTE